MLLEIDQISQAYGQDKVLADVSFQLSNGQIGCLLGPSGCGKSTVLRCIVGFERVLSGRIFSDDVLLSSRDTHVPTEKRRIGMVFQDFALLPHLTATRFQYGPAGPRSEAGIV